MPFRRADAEAVLEPRQPLRAEGDLGQQDEGLTAAAEGIGE